MATGGKSGLRVLSMWEEGEGLGGIRGSRGARRPCANFRGILEQATVSRRYVKAHRFKVRQLRFQKDLRGSNFTQRVVHIWNELPEKVVEA
eukprot:g35080.t1